jgi:hypothetical protein
MVPSNDLEAYLEAYLKAKANDFGFREQDKESRDDGTHDENTHDIMQLARHYESTDNWQERRRLGAGQ